MHRGTCALLPRADRVRIGAGFERVVPGVQVLKPIIEIALIQSSFAGGLVDRIVRTQQFHRLPEQVGPVLTEKLPESWLRVCRRISASIAEVRVESSGVHFLAEVTDCHESALSPIERRPLTCREFAVDIPDVNVRHASNLSGRRAHRQDPSGHATAHRPRLLMSSKTAWVGAGSGEVPGRTLLSRLPVLRAGVALSWDASWPGAGRGVAQEGFAPLEVALPVLADSWSASEEVGRGPGGHRC
jgi:hypothetical protein